MFELAVFDMAHTTVDDRDEVYRVLRESTEREGAIYSDETFARFMGTEKKWAIENLLREGGINVTEDRVNSAWEWFRKELNRTYAAEAPRALDGIEDMLARLRAQGVKVALTTGFSQQIVKVILRGLGWDIDAVVAGDEVPAGRPEPYLIQEAMKRVGITETDKVISVGDTQADVVSAQRAGVTSVGVLTGHLTREDFEALGADYILPSAADIMELL